MIAVAILAILTLLADNVLQRRWRKEAEQSQRLACLAWKDLREEIFHQTKPIEHHCTYHSPFYRN